MMIIGMILTVVGGMGVFSNISTIVNNRRYTFTAPFSDYETRIMTLLVFSFIVAIIGIMLMIFAAVKSKNEERLRGIQNIQGIDVNGNILVKGKCPNCNLNIAEECTRCPRCGQEIRRN